MAWLGDPRDALDTLASVGADRDEDGRFLITGKPVVHGLDGDLLIPDETNYLLGGNAASFAGLMHSTGRGVNVVAIM